MTNLSLELRCACRGALLAAFVVSLAQIAAPAALGQGAVREPAQHAAPRTAPGAEGDEEYLVRPGETLNGIAARLLHEGETRRVQRALAQHNRLQDPTAIRPGQVLRLPRAWLKAQPGALEVAAVQGEVLSAGRPLAAGARLAAGDEVRTGGDGYVTLKLADGSTLLLTPAVEARIDRAQVSPGVGTTDTSVRLERGRAEAAVQRPAKGGTRFEIRTPVAHTAVRGTKFRVAVDGARQRATSEVLEGGVGVTDVDNRGSVNVPSGFGTRTSAGEVPLAPRPLLPAPVLWSGVRLVTRTPADLEFSPLRGAQAYRAALSASQDFKPVLSERLANAAQVSLPVLSDGDYFVRVRGIDDITLEGFDAFARVRVRLREEPPRPSRPPDKSRIYGDAVEFAWLGEPEAAGYVLEIAREAAFRSLAGQWRDLRQPRHAVANLAPGEYFWRVASLARGGQLSLYSVPRALSVRPAPQPMHPARIEEDAIVLSWPAQPGQRFEVQMAADPDFGGIAAEQRTAEPGATLPRPAPGTYYLRLRLIDADGSASPYTATRVLEVPAKAPKPACLVEGPAGACAVFAPPPGAPR